MVCCLLFFGGSWQSTYAESFADVQHLLDNKQYTAVWKQLQTYKKNKEGDPEFDYLYGVSAFETGNYDQAIFALDRVTVVSPHDINARIYLARTYRKLNNNQAVLKQFRELRKLQKISNFSKDTQRSIKELESNTHGAFKSTLNTAATFSIGYSDNINFGSDDSSIDSPTLGVVTLPSSAKRKKSSFSEARLNISIQKPLSSDHTWLSSVKFSKKKFTADSKSDLSVVKLQTGSLRQKGKYRYSVGLHTQPVYLDDKYFSNTVGVGAGIAYQLDKEKRLKVSLTLENQTDKQYSDQNKRRIALLGSYTLSKKNTQHQSSLFLAKETPTSGGNDQYARNILKASYRASHQWNPKNLSFANVSHQISDHKGLNSVYGQKRKDSRSSLSLGHEYRVTKKATAYINAEYIDSKSNLHLYETDRSQVSTGVSFHF